MGKVSRALDKAGAPIKPDGNSPVPPAVTTRSHNAAIEKKKVAAGKETSSSSAPAVNTFEGWDERLVAANKNFSGVTESFRKLRTKILYPVEGDVPRSILIISADAEEGKSFVCANLGVSLAHSIAQHALMIDCDLRLPSLAGLFGLDNSPGLVDYLRGEEDFARLVQETGLPSLSILPAGLPPENPAELVGSGRMAGLLDEATNGYSDGLILLDCPPFQAVSESAVLAQLVDKVILVVRWGRAGRENVKKLVEQIGRDKIIGIVFNSFERNILDRKMQDVGYHNYYSERYY